MTDAVTLNITGRVQTTVVANIRQGSASTSAPVVRKLGAGSPLAVYAAVAGESVQGNPHWYLIGADQYVWAGACSPLSDGGQNFATNKSTPLPEASSTETGDATVTNFAGSGAPLSEAGVENAVAALNVTAPALWSVLSVETSGCGFLTDRRPKILFERHIFHRLTSGKWDAEDPDVSAPSRGGYGQSGAHQYLRLAAAMQLDADAALQSASWGLGQIMGENYKLAGYGSVEGMVSAFVGGEDAQLAGMANFIRYSGMAAALKAHDWSGFARRYNGPDYASGNYDGHLALFYAHLVTAGLPDLQVRACQVYLGYKGYDPGQADGVAGPKTTAAIRRFQVASGLPVNGLVDATLLERIAE